MKRCSLQFMIEPVVISQSVDSPNARYAVSTVKSINVKQWRVIKLYSCLYIYNFRKWNSFNFVCSSLYNACIRILILIFTMTENVYRVHHCWEWPGDEAILLLLVCWIPLHYRMYIRLHSNITMLEYFHMESSAELLYWGT